MRKCEVGDRVTVVKGGVFDNGKIQNGMLGTVIEVREKEERACVEFDCNIGGHGNSCGSKRGKDGHCWWINYCRLLPEPIETKKIVITSDGKETLVRLYEGNKVIEKAVAKCSPDDEYDFEKGAKIAFDRLMGREIKTVAEPPKYYNGKVVCVERESPFYPFTFGKIYEFKDGQTVNDNGFTVPTYRIKSLDEFKCKFIPLVED